MGITRGKVNQHWNYFLAFDEDLETLSRYVEFHEDNYRCFSVEIARVLLAAASEVDVVAKLLCKKISAKSKAKTIDAYRTEICAKYPKIAAFEVVAARYGLRLQPWDQWSKGKSPFWWKAYNDVKHERDKSFGDANLKNLLNAVAGLFVMCLYLYKEEAVLDGLIPSPRVLSAGRAHLRGFRPTGIDVYMFE